MTKENHHSAKKENESGSLLFAILIGIIVSVIGTSIIGIIAGFLYFAFGVRFLKFIGCAIVVLLIVGHLLISF